MNSINRLGTLKKKRPKRPWLLPAIGVIAIGLVAYASYLVIEARKDGRTIVAIDSGGSGSGNNGNGGEESSDTRGNRQQASTGTTPTGNNAIDEPFDLKKVKPLSPLDPLPGNPPENPGPSFKPKTVPAKRVSDWVPLPDLVEKSEFGPLPKISDGDVRPLDAYSQASGMTGANRVAIIVGGLGLSQTGTQSAIKNLPSSITLGFSPLGNSLQRWMQTARREGHEILLQLPMEPLGYPSINPGPRTLTSTATSGENLMNLRWALGRMTNYPLVMNYLGAGLTSKPEAMRPLLQEIRDRGLGYIDDGSASASTAVKLAGDLRLPHASGNIVIDSTRNAARMRANLQVLESLAKTRGFAIGTASAFDESVDVLNEWVKQAKERGIIIVPVSNLLNDYGR